MGLNALHRKISVAENCILNLCQVFKKHAVSVIREHREGVEWVGREALQMILCKLITAVGKTTQNHNQVSNIIFGLQRMVHFFG